MAFGRSRSLRTRLPPLSSRHATPPAAAAFPTRRARCSPTRRAPSSAIMPKPFFAARRRNYAESGGNPPAALALVYSTTTTTNVHRATTENRSSRTFGQSQMLLRNRSYQRTTFVGKLDSTIDCAFSLFASGGPTDYVSVTKATSTSSEPSTSFTAFGGPLPALQLEADLRRTR